MSSVTVDSRDARPGSLFVALDGQQAPDSGGGGGGGIGIIAIYRDGELEILRRVAP